MHWNDRTQRWMAWVLFPDRSRRKIERVHEADARRDLRVLLDERDRGTSGQVGDLRGARRCVGRGRVPERGADPVVALCRGSVSKDQSSGRPTPTGQRCGRCRRPGRRREMPQGLDTLIGENGSAREAVRGDG